MYGTKIKFSCDKSLFKQYGSSIFELPGRRGPKPWHCMNLHHMERSLYPLKTVFAFTQTFNSSRHQIKRSLNFPSLGLRGVKPMSHKAALVLSRSHKYHGFAAEALDKSFLGRQFQHVVKFQPRRCKLLWQTQYNYRSTSKYQIAQLADHRSLFKDSPVSVGCRCRDGSACGAPC